MDDQSASAVDFSKALLALALRRMEREKPTPDPTSVGKCFNKSIESFGSDKPGSYCVYKGAACVEVLLGYEAFSINGNILGVEAAGRSGLSCTVGAAGYPRGILPFTLPINQTILPITQRQLSSQPVGLTCLNHQIPPLVHLKSDS